MDFVHPQSARLVVIVLEHATVVARLRCCARKALGETCRGLVNCRGLGKKQEIGECKLTLQVLSAIPEMHPSPAGLVEP